MTLTDLPAELILAVASHLTEGEVAKLLPVSKHLCAQLSEYLLHRNANRKSMRALLWATSKTERLSVAQRLIQYGADINRSFSLSHGFENTSHLTLLHFATFERRPSMVSTLLALGADPSLTDSWGQTAMFMAYWNQDEEAVRYLLKKIVNPNEYFVQPDSRYTPLHMACSAGLTTTLIQEHLDMGFDISVKDYRDRTALDRAKTTLLCSQNILGHKDFIVRWTRLLLILGDDIVSARSLMSRFVDIGEEFYQRAQTQGSNAQVSHPWFETPIQFSHNLDDITVSEFSSMD